MDSVKMPYDQCIKYVSENVKLDPGFNDYLKWAIKNNIPTVVLSSGMEPIIRAILEKLVGEDAKYIDVICNNIQARPGKQVNEEGGWELVYHDDSHFGHDKSLTIRPYAQLPADQRPTLFYAGDGVSDLSAAKETDLLFAKSGHGESKSAAIFRKDCETNVSQISSNSASETRFLSPSLRTGARSRPRFSKLCKFFTPFLYQYPKTNQSVSSEGKVSVQEAAKQGVEEYEKGQAGVKPTA